MVSNGVGDVAKYLSEAASSIFKTDDSNVPWSGSGSPFSGTPTACLVVSNWLRTGPTKGGLNLLPHMLDQTTTHILAVDEQGASHTMKRFPG